MKIVFNKFSNNKQKYYLFANLGYILCKISSFFCMFAVLLLALIPFPILASGQTKNQDNMVDTQFAKGLENFGIRLFSELTKRNRQKNIVFSPFSIQTCIAMARMGAEGETAFQMDEGLALSAQNPEDLAKHYHSVLAVYENSPILKIVNKIFIMQGYEIQTKFNEVLTKQFFSSAESLNFAESQESAKAINSWIESKTNSLIRDLVSPQVLNRDTRLVLVNAIHFKGEWQNRFPESATREMDFYLDETNTIKVQMMHLTKRFRYGEFENLDATALEMPYNNSDLSMLIILPNSRTGLADLEEKLKNVTLQELTQNMYTTKVIVDMPKFKAEFEVELSDPLKKMGMTRMFSNAEFGKMLKSNEPLQISKVIHKAFIEVNEKGTEAAAATGIVIRNKRALLESDIKEFHVEHPFFYSILHKTETKASTAATNLLLFAGSIVRPAYTTKQIKDEL